MRSLFRRELWTRELVAWYLYDFANSFVYINATLYFSQWVVVDQGRSDLVFALPFIIATTILIFTASYVGDRGDRSGAHGRMFVSATLLAFVSFAGMFAAGRFLPHPLGVSVALVLFGCYQLGYLFSFVPYNVFIKFISPPALYGTVSGMGFAWSELGNIAGLLLTFPIAQGTWLFFGDDRLAPLVPALVAFAALSLPALFIFGRKKMAPVTRPAPVSWWKTFWRHLMESRAIAGVFPLLLAFYFFSDALQTVSLYSAIYLEKVFNAPDTTKVVMFILVLVGFAVGSLVSGVLSDRAGHRKVLVYSLVISGVSIVGLSLANHITFLYPVFVLFGIASGGVYVASRSYLAALVPQEESGKFFGLYTFAERFASVIGPALWGLIIFGGASVAPLNYRMAAFAMGLIALLGIIPLRRRV